MKLQADKNRTERVFQVGDWVYLKLQLYIQKSIATRANPKLAFKFYGPFQVIKKIGSVAYELKLPETASVHPVFHVSQLKYAVGQQVPSSPVLPSTPEELTVPEAILKNRQVRKGSSLVTQILVKWSGIDEEMATWEDKNELQAKFPEAAVWGQTVFEEGKNVTTRRVRKWRQRRDHAACKREEARLTEEESGRPLLRRSTRQIRSNTRVTGAEWTK